jgi:hypothetical protein
MLLTYIGTTGTHNSEANRIVRESETMSQTSATSVSGRAAAGGRRPGGAQR